jgi:hypothetical protein
MLPIRGGATGRALSSQSHQAVLEAVLEAVLGADGYIRERTIFQHGFTAIKPAWLDQAG